MKPEPKTEESDTESIASTTYSPATEEPVIEA
jgi:hypothetical protein